MLRIVLVALGMLCVSASLNGWNYYPSYDDWGDYGYGYGNNYYGSWNNNYGNNYYGTVKPESYTKRPYVNLSHKNKQKLEDQYENLIVMFTMDQCGYCKYMKPIMDEVKDRYGDEITILFVDIKKHPSYPSQYGFTTVPHIAYFKDGKQLEAHGSGDKTMTVQQVIAKIKKHFDL